MEQFGIWWAIGGILLTATLTTFGTWWVTRYTLRSQAKINATVRDEESKRHEGYLAVRVVSVLEPYAMRCIDVVNDDGEFDQRGERRASVPRPDLMLPQDVDWKSIDVQLMDRILTIPNKMENASASVNFVGEMLAGPPYYEEVFEERRYQWAKLGLLALDIASDLRTTYGLQQPDYSMYDPREVLKKHFVAAHEARQRGAKVASSIIASHEAKLS